MKVDISNLLLGNVDRIPVSETINIEEDKNSINVKFTKPIAVEGEIFRSEGQIFIDAIVHCEYLENCSRCLEEFKNSLNASLSANIIERDKATTKDESNEDFIIYYEGNKVDLENPIITSIVLNLPMKPLCSEECRGLCLKCGKDLNKGQCECINDTVDPRLLKLKELLD